MVQHFIADVSDGRCLLKGLARLLTQRLIPALKPTQPLKRGLCEHLAKALPFGRFHVLRLAPPHQATMAAALGYPRQRPRYRWLYTLFEPIRISEDHRQALPLQHVHQTLAAGHVFFRTLLAACLYSLCLPLAHPQSQVR